MIVIKSVKQTPHRKQRTKTKNLRKRQTKPHEIAATGPEV